ncbi:MAG: hypothetical protein V3T81_07020 [Thermoanaerobaculia bacterium]
MRRRSSSIPRDEGAHFGRGISLLLAGRYPEARSRLEASVTALPEKLPFKHALARPLATRLEAGVRDGARAPALAREVFSGQQNLELADTVAMAHAELGRFEEAAQWQRRIIEQAEASGRSELLPRLRERLALYQRHEPCRAPWLRGTTPANRP